MNYQHPQQPQPYPQQPYQQQPFQQPPRPVPPKKKTPWWVWVAAAFGALVLLGAIGNAVDGGKDKAATTAAPAPLAAAPAETTQASAPVVVPTSNAAAVVKDLTIPELAGKNGAIAADELKRLGFTNVTYGSATPGVNMVLMLSNWTVQSVEPGPGTTLPSNSAVVLMMTKNNH
ncbi:PASTA domain-containing protein [Nocardia yamanashiensis]|uniref:PASTA domain-containing protein n=1 Tax=Nocardia yamanashiensis TaxID=209247 RepID=UPI001E45A026|nr:PASTA domain-containing protein [Nocardia yamanashiensis]UGT40857.1 PASTA domain-containing protein [Nocardia yamanashiensis]